MPTARLPAATTRWAWFRCAARTHLPTKTPISSGPTVGSPSARSLGLFFLASYDIGGFREFVASPDFNEVFELDPGFRQTLMQDDSQLLRFGFRLLQQVLFGENTIPLKPDAAQKRVARYQERKQQSDTATQLSDAQDRLYDSLGD